MALTRTINAKQTWERRLLNTTRQSSIWHYRLSRVNGKSSKANLGIKSDGGSRDQQDEEFLKWLSPSQWLVESQLAYFRKERKEDTLKWAHVMPEFQAWMKSDLRPDSRERLLWISGPLGIGKSIMSAYFIDLLKTLYPNSIVAYFFCRSGQKGLTSAQDIVRTISYQCIQGDEDARSFLEDLRKKAFKIEELVGLRFLTQRLITEPVQQSARDVFIVLDGMDEADLEIPDAAARVKPHPEIHVLLQQLACTPRSRLLIVSRPNPIVKDALPEIVRRPVGQRENWKDIETYVNETISKSMTLKASFAKINTDPVKYFDKHAKGIFLWVVLVLKQLEAAETVSIFRRHVETFSNASGDMNVLYSNILSKYSTENRKWLTEILTWLVAAEEGVTLTLVKDAAEWFLGDERLQFDEFVKVDCGTLLHLISTESEMRIELVHETLRTFLTEAEACPIPIPLRDAHDHILRICLDILSSERDDSSEEDKTLKSYASENWFEHVSDVTSLGLVRTFLESDSFKWWISSKPFETSVDLYTGRIGYNQEENVNEFCRAIRALIVADKSNLVDTDLSWVQDDKMIYLYAGKAWTEIWAHGDSSLCLQAFVLVLRSYCCRSSRTSHDFDPKAIAHNTFSVLLGDSPRYPLKNGNLGIACAILREWDKSVEYLSGLSSRHETTEILGLAYIRTGDYNKAAETLKHIADSSEMACVYLGLAYWANRNVGSAIEAFEDVWNRQATKKTLVRLGCLYCLQESANKTEIYERGVVRYNRSWWAWQFLGAAYLGGGELRKSCRSLFESACRKS